MFERTKWHSIAEQQSCLQEERNFVLEFLNSGARATDTVTIEHLQQVARIRLCLDMTADLVVNTTAGK